ncbi:MAG TPA: hypothetical protein VGH28_16775 [Polyangiaceae bacterium]
MSRYLHITWLSLGNGGVHLVARCELCRVVVERSIGESPAQALLNVIASEALADGGCAHVDEVMRTGARRVAASGTQLRQPARPNRG